MHPTAADVTREEDDETSSSLRRPMNLAPPTDRCDRRGDLVAGPPAFSRGTIGSEVTWTGGSLACSMVTYRVGSSGTATVVYVLGGLYGLGLILGIGLFGRDRLAIARDMIAASALALAGLIGLSYLAGPEFPDLLPEFVDNGTYPSFPSGRLALIVAALRVSQNYLTVPMRNVGRRIIVALSIAALILIYGTVTGVIGGLLLGVAASSTIRYVFGTGTGIPSSQRIEAGLREAGLDVRRCGVPASPARRREPRPRRPSG